ncbi:hypothetical protein CIRG_06769 [Coccidioides immitis RMSCC 2394]|uniref:Uncharacterized protein n=1 Tax=Coccidioides immitis RMSCC 2394 TaxID=404692 RepID=A0A0J6YJJ0_COCIT|nr:hypothetical protein CIRG_06769 [Coccidioides immitis RMSCC 2394]
MPWRRFGGERVLGGQEEIAGEGQGGGREGEKEKTGWREEGGGSGFQAWVGQCEGDEARQDDDVLEAPAASLLSLKLRDETASCAGGSGATAAGMVVVRFIHLRRTREKARCCYGGMSFAGSSRAAGRRVCFALPPLLWKAVRPWHGPTQVTDQPVNPQRGWRVNAELVGG